MCGALPCDWTDDPHHHQNLAIWTLAKIREVTGVGIKPMLTELPDAIASEIERLRAENDDQAHKLLIAGWRKEDDGSVWIPPENEEVTRLRGEAEAREAEITALVESTREAQQAYVQADNESLRLRGEVERLSDSVDGLKADLFEAVSVAYNRGAVEWGFLNYRSWIDRIEANSHAEAVRLSNLQGE